jgi:thiamine-phosphate pyrophosphorylase
LPAKIIRQNFPENFIVGVSTHTLDEVALARDEGADFVTFSPIYKTPSKAKYGEPQGLEKLKIVCRKLNLFPVIALGGIDETNFSQVLESGSAGFAAIRFLKELLQRGEAEAQRFFVELRNERE